MERRRRVPAWLGLLAAALLGAGTTWVLLAWGEGDREVAGTPASVASLEGRVAQLERELEAARAAPRPVEGLAAPPSPAEVERRARLEQELVATKRRLEEAVAERDAARTARALVFGGDGDGGSVRVELPEGAFGPGATVTPGGAVSEGSAAPVDLGEAERLLRSDREEDRRAAYAMLARAAEKAALPLLEEALATSAAGSATGGLMRRAAALKDRAWSALQATGAPDTPVDGDNPTAWAPKQPEMGEVTIDLEYEAAVRVDEVRIRETFNPGAVVKVLAFERGRGWDVLWEGAAPAEPGPRWFAPPVRRTAYATSTIRLVLDTNRVADWNEVDAVELVGDGQRQWARAAVPSSSYAD